MVMMLLINTQATAPGTSNWPSCRYYDHFTNH
jgi:hypothetical protein